jgi:hypothetical protein
VSYFLSAVFFDLIPLRVVPAIVVAAIIYAPVGLNASTPGHVLTFAVLLILASVSFGTIALFIGAVSTSLDVANFIGGLSILTYLAFAGVFLNLNEISKWVAWMQYLTPARFSFDAMITNELDGAHFKGGREGERERGREGERERQIDRQRPGWRVERMPRKHTHTHTSSYCTHTHTHTHTHILFSVLPKVSLTRPLHLPPIHTHTHTHYLPPPPSLLYPRSVTQDLPMFGKMSMSLPGMNVVSEMGFAADHRTLSFVMLVVIPTCYLAAAMAYIQLRHVEKR